PHHRIQKSDMGCTAGRARISSSRDRQQKNPCRMGFRNPTRLCEAYGRTILTANGRGEGKKKPPRLREGLKAAGAGYDAAGGESGVAAGGASTADGAAGTSGATPTTSG